MTFLALVLSADVVASNVAVTVVVRGASVTCCVIGDLLMLSCNFASAAHDAHDGLYMLQLAVSVII